MVLQGKDGAYAALHDIQKNLYKVHHKTSKGGAYRREYRYK
ncbi:hypothetical protein SXM_1753 [Shewanella xiamenensis]|nr:hypothetical protein SXM_1753 [Shewanella xiamenensis]